MKSIIIHTSEILSKKTISKSIAGHMWLTLIDKDKRESIGFGIQEKDHHSSQNKESKGRILKDDDINYLEKWNSNEILIDDDQFDRIKHFVSDVRSNIENGDGEFSHYNVANQNCVEFVWRALKYAGIVEAKDRTPAHSMIPPMVHDLSNFGFGLGLVIVNKLPGSQKYSSTLMALSEDGMTKAAYLEATASEEYRKISTKAATEFANINGIEDWTTWGKKGFRYWKPFLKYSLRHEDTEALYEKMIAVYGLGSIKVARDYMKAEGCKNQKLLEVLGENEIEAVIAQRILEINKKHFSEFNAMHPFNANEKAPSDANTVASADFNAWKVVNALSIHQQKDVLLGGEMDINQLDILGRSPTDIASSDIDSSNQGLPGIKR